MAQQRTELSEPRALLRHSWKALYAIGNAASFIWFSIRPDAFGVHQGTAIAILPPVAAELFSLFAGRGSRSVAAALAFKGCSLFLCMLAYCILYVGRVQYAHQSVPHEDWAMAMFLVVFQTGLASLFEIAEFPFRRNVKP